MEAHAVNGLGKDVFIKMLTTELKYQDPLQPMDSAAFITQLAQFSELEEMGNIRALMDGVAASLTSVNNLGMAGLIGKDVQVEGRVIPHVEGLPDTLKYYLGTNAGSVSIKIQNSAGDVVRKIGFGAQLAGMNSAVWDGFDNNGNLLPSGDYIFSVEAKDAANSPVTVAEYTFGRVTGVNYKAGVPYFIVNGGEVPAATVSEVRSSVQ